MSSIGEGLTKGVKMKGKVFKRISALVLATVMTLAMGTMAFAAEIGTDGTAGSATESAGNSVIIKKAIKITNYEGYAYEPTITYTYTLTDGPAPAANNTVTDADGVTAVYKKGLTSYVSGDAAKTAVFDKETAATSGENATKDLTWTFDPSKFPSAGVYRFAINETTSVDPASIGIARPAAYDTSKFLDVFVKNGTEGLEIYGYALVDDDAAVTTDSAKSQGWNAGDDLDEYNTYNITITKHITGNLADMTAKFPFKVALTGEMSAANIAVEGTGDAISLSEGTVTGSLGDGATIVIKGLPTTVKFAVTEDNPTLDQYKTTATVANVTDTTNAAEANLNGSVTNFSVVSDGDIANATAAITIDVENHMDIISPTGLVLRYAPFALILVAGIVLLALSRRKKDA